MNGVRAAALLLVNLALGTVLLVWLLHGFGGEALGLLARGAAPLGLFAFGCAAAVTVVAFAWRWFVVGSLLGLRIPVLRLALYRSAGHGVATLIPSGRVGADPLRAWLAARDAGGARAIATVAVDRGLELGAASAFSIVFVTVLAQQGVPDLAGVLVTVGVGVLALAGGVAIAVARLRRGAGLVSALVRGARLDRVGVVQDQLGLIEEAEAAFARVLAHHRALAGAFALGLLANLLVLVEIHLLLAAFGLPAGPVAVVAATFASAASHLVPVPAGVGVLEGTNIWLFGVLGYPPEIGLAVGLAERLRDLVWFVPGLVYLLARSAGPSLRWVRGAGG